MGILDSLRNCPVNHSCVSINSCIELQRNEYETLSLTAYLANGREIHVVIGNAAESGQ